MYTQGNMVTECDKVNRRTNSVVLATFVALGLMGSSGCFIKKQPSVFTPPPPQAKPKVAETPTLADPPLIAGDPESTLPVTPNSVPEAPAPPKPVPQPKKQPVATAPPKPTATPTPDQPDPPPSLAPIFTNEERREYNKSIDDSLEHVRRDLAALAKKNLNPDQQKEINLISTFQKQAEQAREAQDLTTAVNIAKRAEVLAADLLSRFP
jgi:hypothetical protein